MTKSRLKRGLEQLGLIWNVWRIPTDRLQARSRPSGLSSEYRYGAGRAEGNLNTTYQQHPGRRP